jgi:phosphoglycerol transferase MdoB-like AlkP superfamily enzyme
MTHRGRATMDKMNLCIKLNWKSRRNIPVYLLFLFFLFITTTYIRQNTWQDMIKDSVVPVIVLWIVISLLSLIEIKNCNKFFAKCAKWIDRIILLLTPAVSFLMIEVMVSNQNKEMFKKYSPYNIIWYYVICFMIYALIRNAKITVMIYTTVIFLTGFLNYLVYIFRGNPVLPSDLLAWQTGMSVASNYHLSFTKGFLIASLLFLVLIVLGSRLQGSRKKISLTNRLFGIAIYMIFALGTYSLFFRTNLIRSTIPVIDYFAPKYTYSTYGTVFGFVANVKAMEVKSPQGYSLSKVEEAFNKIGEDSAKEQSDDRKPNIIVIMNEAFSDLRLIGNYKTNMDYLPNIRALKENTIKGSLYVSVFGGATSDTEYEFLTGNSMAVMPQNCVPFQQFVTDPTDSLASILKEQGYYNIAIHPYIRSDYKRDFVYPLLGFDEYLSMEAFEDPELIRSYISDRENYKKIIEEYETKGKDNPLFIFNVTMQNHGGYSTNQLFEEEDTVKFQELQGYGSTEQYLSLIRESDKAFQTLVDYFSKQTEPTIILMFGDHQPIAFSKIHDALENINSPNYMKELQKKYMVPYILWANYDITQDAPDKMSANYLSSYLLQIADLKGTEYNNYLLELSQKIPVINGLFYIDKENKIHKIEELSKYSDYIKEYRYVGYNNALDRKNRLKKYYSLEKG